MADIRPCSLGSAFAVENKDGPEIGFGENQLVGQVELVGIGALVERVRGHRGDRADLVGVRRLDRERVVLDDGEVRNS